MYIGRISHFCKIKNMDVELHSLTGFFGKNSSGKTSIKNAMGAVACGCPLPMKGIKKKDARDLVQDDAKKGMVELIQDAGQSSISYPSLKIKTEKTPVVSSEYATGLTRLDEILAKELPNVLSSYMKVLPDKDDLIEALKDIGMTEGSRETVWDQIDNLGWDAVCKNVAQKSTGLKGQWKEAARENYGSDKAKNWIPENYDPEMENQSEEHYQAILVESTEFLNAAIKEEAVSDSNVDDLTKKAESLGELKTELEGLKKKGSGLKKLIDKLVIKRDIMPQPSTEANAKCPHCKKAFIVSGSHAHYNVVKPVKITAEQNKKRAAAIVKVNNIILEHTKDRKSIELSFNSVVVKIKNAKSAIETLNNRPEQNLSENDVSKAQNNVTQARLNLESFQQKLRADGIQKKIVSIEKVKDIVGPEGLRKEKLGKAIDELNDVINEIIPDWNIKFDSDLLVEKDGYAFPLLSESYTYQCIIAFQLAIAKLESAELIIVDRIDIFDSENRTILLKALSKMKAPCIVCSTINKKEKAPDFEKLGVGKSYWVEDGEVSAI